MKKNETLRIIDGNFNYDEAKEILMNILSSKINFYCLKNWSSQERFGIEDVSAQKRIPALRNEVKKLEEILSEAKAKNKQLVVSSDINISFLENAE
jgi:hypothetical protein